jgi:serine/threonine-protein kinase PknK
MLLTTKLRPPGDAGQWITREHVLADVAARHEARRCRACVIAATGGFGKTTLAAQWGERLARGGDAVSWLSRCRRRQPRAALRVPARRAPSSPARR